MPVYEYVCQDCRKTTEAIRRMNQADDPIVCEHCGGKKTQRAHSVFSTTASDSRQVSLPTGGCARCGDPRGSCGL